MTTVIHRENWKNFSDDLSREKLGWQTHIEIISDEIGAQILSEGLMFSGLTFDDKGGSQKFEISVGAGTHSHQTHSVFSPKFVAYEEEATGEYILDIEDSNGAKVITRFIFPATVNHSEER